MDRRVDMPPIGGQNARGRGSIYHGYGDRYAMDRGVDISRIRGLIYHG
jgi:hypothetical protein